MLWADISEDCELVPHKVCVDVGGACFYALSSTLTKSTYFSKNLKTLDYIFVDRDPSMFTYVLNFLRSNTLFISGHEDESFLKMLQNEAVFFGIPAMQEEIEESIQTSYSTKVLELVVDIRNELKSIRHALMSKNVALPKTRSQHEWRHE